MINLRIKAAFFFAVMVTPAFLGWGNPLLADDVAQDISGHAHVIDGDTIRIDGQSIRLYGIDAPELNQDCTYQDHQWPCGQYASAYLDSLLDGHITSCKITSYDHYKRAIAICFNQLGQEVNQEMVAVGLAVAYLRYSFLCPVNVPARLKPLGIYCRYQADQDRAQSQNLGIWQGDFIMPEVWRRTHR